MKNNKKTIWLITGLALAAVLAMLLLTMCGRGGGEEPVLESAPSSEPAESTCETTEAVEETTEPTEESSAPTEAPTESTEEATEPGSGGNSSPGGTGGPWGDVGGDDEDEDEDQNQEEEEELVISAPGAADNPYVEAVAEYPAAFTTVQVPQNGVISYEVYGVNGKVLSIEDGDAYVVVGDVTYQANENGVVTVEFPKGENSVPAFFQVGNGSAEGEGYLLSFTLPVGSAGNPRKLESLENITVSVDADDTEGYFCAWTPVEDGTLSLTLDGITPAEAVCEIVVTCGDQTAMLSESTDGIVTLEVGAEETVTIRVIVKPEGTAAEAVISGSFAPGSGTASNPYLEAVSEMPGSFETVEIPAEKEYYYNVFGVSGSILTIEDPEAYVVYNGECYTADENGVVTLFVESESPRVPVTLVIGNSGSEAESYTVDFVPPVGSFNNPEVIEDITQVAVAVEEGCESGYYLQWTATDTGVLSIEAAVAPDNVGFDVVLTNMNSYAMSWLSEGSPVTMDVALGDVVKIQVAIVPDASWNYPAAQVTLTGTLIVPPGTVNNPYTAEVSELPGSVETVEIPAGEAVCYAISNAAGTLLTIENAEAYVIYNGETYTPDETGMLTVEIAPDAAGNPVSLQIGNSGEAAQSYLLTFAPTTGSAGNPETVYDLRKLDTWIEAGSGGYYYTWTAAGDGAVSFWVDEELSPYTGCDIILTNGETVAKRSESDNGVVSLAVTEGDTVQILVAADAAAYVAVRGTVVTGEGSKEKPYMTTVTEIPSSVGTVEIPNGTEFNYSIYRIGDTILSIEDADAYVVYDGVTYYPVDGVVSVRIQPSGPMSPVPLVIGNTYTEAEQRDGLAAESEAYELKFVSPLGVYGNPEVLSDVTSFTAKLEEGNEVGYYFQWTAPEAGVVVFWVESITEGVSCDVTLTCSTSYANNNLTGSEDGTVSIEVEADSVVTILVSVLPDGSWNYPAATVGIAGSFQAAAAAEEQTEDPGEAAEMTEPETEETEPTTGETSEQEPAAEDTAATEATESGTPDEVPAAQEQTEPTEAQQETAVQESEPEQENGTQLAEESQEPEETQETEPESAEDTEN